MTTPQSYGDYTPADFEVWAELFQRQTRFLEGRVCPEYHDGVAALGLNAETIPEFSALSDRLERITGWRLEAVEGALSSEEFFGLTAVRRFPCSTKMRPRAELTHSKAPDMFHDVFGHIPLLTNPIYCDYMMAMSHVALQRIANPAAIKRLGWAYKWTIEYGLMGFGPEQMAYGAGLISSSKELDFVFTDEPRKLAFTPGGVLAASHVPASLQERYFVIQTFQELSDSVPKMAEILDQMPLAYEAGG